MVWIVSPGSIAERSWGSELITGQPRSRARSSLVREAASEMGHHAISVLEGDECAGIEDHSAG
jgi:hypothetical protein